MSAFSGQELGYLLGERRLARVATPLIRIRPERVRSWGLG